MPRITPAKNGLLMSATITPSVCVMPVVMLRARLFGRYLSFSAAASTRARAAGLTEP